MSAECDVGDGADEDELSEQAASTEGLRRRGSKHCEDELNVDSDNSIVQNRSLVKQTEDRAGQTYRILSLATVRNTAEVGAGEIVSDVNVGDTVNVVERVSGTGESIRARIDHPVEGWISLRTASGDILAERVDSNDKVDEDAPRCWICHGDDDLEALIAPCACKGSQALVHNRCLLQWLKTKAKQQRRQDSILRCDVCKEVYNVARSKLRVRDMLKIVGYAICMGLFVVFVCFQVYFKVHKIMWVQGSLGGNWFSTLMAGLLVAYNVFRIGSRVWQGMDMLLSGMNNVNNNRVEQVRSRADAVSLPALSS